MAREPNSMLRRRLRKLMTEQHTNGEKVANRAGLNHGAIYDIIEGRSRQPRRTTLARIGHALSVSVAFLTGATNRRK